MSTLEWVTLASLVLAVLALLLATFHLRQGKNHRRSLEFVAGSLSTRYLEKFPRYLEKVTEVISSTEVKVRIISATPAPAFFTDGYAYLHYRQALERLCHERKLVQVVSMRPDLRLDRLKLQFEKADWDAGKYDNEWGAFAPHYPECGATEGKPDYESFISFLACAQAEEARRLRREGVEIRESPTYLTMNVAALAEPRA